MSSRNRWKSRRNPFEFGNVITGKLISDGNNPPGRSYHRIEGNVPAACVLSEPVESCALALEAIDELIKDSGHTHVSRSKIENHVKYMIEKFKDEEQFEATDTSDQGHHNKWM